MIQQLNDLGRIFTSPLERVSIELAILAVIVMTTILLLRIKRPAMRHAFWLLVLLKPLATLLVASPLTLYSLMYPAPPAAVQAIPATSRTMATPRMIEMPRQGVVMPQRRDVAVTAATPAWRKLNRHGLCATLWLLIAAVLGCRLIAGAWYVARLCRSVDRQRSGPLKELLQRTAGIMRVRRPVDVALSSESHGPVLAGILRPVILMPHRLAETLTPSQMQRVFAHELAHVRRWDNLVLLAQRLAEMLLFFHPVVWLCGWMMRREAELACDERVVAQLGGPAEYADSLTRVAEWRCRMSRRLLLSTFAAAESHLSHRIRRILIAPPARTTLTLTLLSIIALIVIACVGLPTSSTRRTTSKEIAMPSPSPTQTPFRSSAAIRREGGKVWIEGVKGFNSGEYADSVHGAQARILQTLGETLDYDDLVAYSGFAFRVGAHKAFCPSAGHPYCGYECIDNGNLALPWRTKMFPGDRLKKEGDAFKAEVYAAIQASIDRGIPVHYGKEEDGLIIGYADDGRRWWCVHPYYKEGREAFWYDEVGGEGLTAFAGGKDQWPWGVMVWLEPKPAAERAGERDLLLSALKQAVQMWRTEKNGDYFCGEAAYAHWLEGLRGIDAGNVKDPKAMMQGNGWCFDVLIHSRRIAGRWLQAKAQQFDGESRKQLLAAADHYARIPALCMKDLNCPWDLAIAPGTFDKWTPAMRSEQVARLEASREHDRAAIAAIEHVLAAEGIDPVVALPVSAILDNVPGGNADWNAFAGGLTLALNHAGFATNYETVMGDLGLAFICQASDQAAKYDGAVDAGWWPLAWDCLPVLLDRAGPSFGVRLNWFGGDYDQYKGDPAGYYRRHLEGAVKMSIASGKPAMENHAFWEVVVGYDKQDQPLTSFCPSGPQKIRRLDKHSICVVTLGESIPRLTRKQADIASLQQAAALGRDRIPMPNGYLTGAKAFALWAACLRDVEHRGEARWHANVVHNLKLNRTAAVGYLHKMAPRHAAKTASHLNAAANRYESVLAELDKADVSQAAIIDSIKGRETLAQLADRVAAIEADAIHEIALALEAEGVVIDHAASGEVSHPVPASVVLLAAVPRVGFYQGPGKGNPEDHPLSSVMRALMEYANDDQGFPGFADQRGKWQWSTCALFHGITGSGFAFAWKQPYGEGYLNRELFHAYDKAFAAAGYDRRMLLRSAFAATQNYNGPVSDDAEEYRRLIVESIRDRRQPVVAIGVIGPVEPCLICGYENDGETLIGWNYFVDDAKTDPRLRLDGDGRFVLRNWFRDLHGIVLPGGKQSPSPDRGKVCRQALREGLNLLCNVGEPDCPMGAAGYAAWLEELLMPLPADVANDPRKIDPLHKRHNEPVGELAERRAYAGTFMLDAADALPATGDELRQASCCYRAMHDLLWRVWQTLGVWYKTDDEKLLRFADPEIRGELASLVRRLQAWDVEAVGHIRQALVRLGVPQAELPALPKVKPVTVPRDFGVEQPLPGQLGRLWGPAETVIPYVPAPDGTGLPAAVKAATAATPWPITGQTPNDGNLSAWAAQAGWQLKIVRKPADESWLSRARRLNDVVLFCLHGLPVATTHNGKPAVIVGYDHLAGETLRVRLPGMKTDDPAERIRMDDAGWGDTWIFLAGRTR
ncbi:MAG: M56 family metallopeptidase [Phycisphaeraceae bacterium]|nr:M56 family metallopeptidase [Phycisphaeraceae bacterium]